MKIYRPSIAAILVATAVVQGSTVRVGPQPETTELARLESVWNEAHLHGDADALDRLWADDLLVFVPRMAPITKAEALRVLRAGRFKFERYGTSETSIRLYGDTWRS